MNTLFWRGKRVLLTGHTGFKGSWLALWLQMLGAKVAGYALPPEGVESLFELASVGDGMDSTYADVRSPQDLRNVVERFRPDVVFHLAAQALVRKSYQDPVETYQVNVMGTVHLLEAVRTSESCRVVVNVTSDKCYQNREWIWGYREGDPLGGHDPYSSSKGCAELVTAAYRDSFFNLGSDRQVAVASARAGNVIGGGDFSKDRLVPDVMAALRNHTSLTIRYPDAIRPWQHVLEPLSGYMLLAERLWESPRKYAQAWNFGPALEDARPVRWIVERLAELWGEELTCKLEVGPKPHEDRSLVLDCAKSRATLGWRPRWTLDEALHAVTDWYRAYDKQSAVREVMLEQIASYEERLRSTHSIREVRRNVGHELPPLPSLTRPAVS